MPDVAAFLRSLPHGDTFAAHPLLAVALAALFLSIMGGALHRKLPTLGGIVRGAGTFGLVVVLVLTAIDFARMNPDLALPQLGVPEQVIDGEETHVPLSGDGHYWIDARVNGHPARFLVDTGASLTAISPETAAAAGIEAQQGLGTVRLETANGSAPAYMARIDKLETGTIAARDLRAVIAPTMNGMNVLGMNFMSQLESWQVKDGTLILVPHKAALPVTG